MNLLSKCFGKIVCHHKWLDYDLSKIATTNNKTFTQMGGLG